MTRFAVVVVERNPQYRFGKFLGYQTNYATVISSSRTGQLMLEGGREEVFGKTIGEVDFREVNSREQGEKIAAAYNNFLVSGKRLKLREIN